MQDELGDVLAQYKAEEGSLIPILQGVQEKLGYLPEEAISKIAEFSQMSESEVFGVASFYTQFYFTPRGQYTVKVCLGTACHIRGGDRILDRLENSLNIKPGETTEDYKFGLERVACFGCCALAPVVVINEDIHTKVSPSKAGELLKGL